MEFTIFLNLLTIGLMLLFYIGVFFAKFADKYLIFSVIMAAASILLFFIDYRLGIYGLLFFTLALIDKRVNVFKKHPLLKRISAFSVMLLIFSFWYLSFGKSDVFWNSFFEIFYSSGLLKGLFINVLDVIRFFGYHYPIYPAVFTATLMFAYDYGAHSNVNKMTFWYRYVKTFDHRQVYLTIGSFLLLGVAHALSSLNYGAPLRAHFSSEFCIMMKDLMLNITVFYALPYILLGFLTVIFGLRKLKLSYILCLVIIYSFIILSGPIFIFTFILLMGLGITDIWMNYQKRKIKLY